jgi:hypothetical protein
VQARPRGRGAQRGGAAAHDAVGVAVAAQARGHVLLEGVPAAVAQRQPVAERRIAAGAVLDAVDVAGVDLHAVRAKHVREGLRHRRGVECDGQLRQHGIVGQPVHAASTGARPSAVRSCAPGWETARSRRPLGVAAPVQPAAAELPVADPPAGLRHAVGMEPAVVQVPEFDAQRRGLRALAAVHRQVGHAQRRRGFRARGAARSRGGAGSPARSSAAPGPRACGP